MSDASKIVISPKSIVIKSEESENKYSLVEELDIDGHTMYRIQAERDIPEINVRKGQLGGCIERKSQLSQEGTCWLAASSMLFGNTEVTNSAYVGENCKLNHVIMRNNTRVVESIMRGVEMTGNASVHFSTVIGDFTFGNDAEIRNCELSGVLHLAGTSRIHLQKRKFFGNKFLDMDVTRSSDVIDILGISTDTVSVLSCTDNIRVMWGAETISAYSLERTLKRHRINSFAIEMVAAGVKLLEQRNLGS